MTWPRPDVAHWLVSGELMAALEQDWLASGLPVPSLMEKVGLAMAAWLLERPTWLNAGVLVLVGPGHNGGDGLVVARELAQAGVAVRLWLPMPIRASLTQQHLDHARWLGIPSSRRLPIPPIRPSGSRPSSVLARVGLCRRRSLPCCAGGSSSDPTSL